MAERVWKTGQILSRRQTGRSYGILNENGNVISRNRIMVRPDKTTPDMTIVPVCAPSTHDKPQPSETKEPIQPSRNETVDPYPVRRSVRDRNKTQFFGNPVSH